MDGVALVVGVGAATTVTCQKGAVRTKPLRKAVRAKEKGLGSILLEMLPGGIVLGGFGK